MRNQWAFKVLSAIMIAILAVAALPATPARAATITVNTNNDENINNGNCSLREAIVAANTNAAYNGCSAGGGASDTIVLIGGSTYALTINGNGSDGDLDITSAITIQSSNTTLAVIDPGATFTDRVFQLTNTGTLTLNTIRITTVSSGNDGAVVDNGGGVVSITNSAFDNNAATGNNNDGGVYNQNGGTLTVSNSTFNNNSAAGDEGGAIYSSGGTVTILNSTFYGNTADLGGAIRVTGGTLNISFSSFSNNTASAGNGGDVHASGGGTNLRIFRSYLVNPVTTTINCYSSAGGAETITSNLVEGNAAAGNACGGAVSTAFADTLTLGNNGGPTQTLAITSSMTNIYNAAGACTDYNGAAVAADQRGITRPQAGSCDRGAFELVANTAPTTSGISNVAVLEDAANTSIDLWSSFADAEDADNQLTYTVTGNTNPALFTSVTPPAPGGQYLVLDYAPNANGSSTITVRATDTGGLFVETSFTVTVTAVNDAPSFVKGADQTVNEDAGAQTVNGWATAISAGPANESGQTLAFNITGNTNPALFSAAPAVNPANGNLTYTPAPNANGSATITLTLSDNGGTANGGVDTSAPQTFVVTVNPVNDAPSFVKGADQTVVEDAGPQTVNGWATAISAGPANESGQTLTFNITGNTNPALFSVAPAVNPANGNLAYTPAPNANGSATITLTLSDNGGTANGGVDTSAPQMFVITVTPVNDPPVVSDIPNQSVPEGGAFASINLDDYVSDPDHADAQMTWTYSGNVELTVSINASRVATIGIPSADWFGSETITFTATDPGGLSAGDPATFTVNAVNNAPFFVMGGDQAVAEDAGPQTVSVWATSISVGPANESWQTPTFQVTNNNNALFSVQPAINAVGDLTYTPAANAHGMATVTVVLRDDGGTANGGVDTYAPTPNTFTITVNAVNDPPFFASAPVTSVMQNNPYAYNIVTDDPDAADTLTITAPTLPSWLSFVDNGDRTATLSGTPTNADVGAHLVVLRVSDGTAVPVDQSFTINVTDVNDAPAFTSAPVVSAGESVPYVYNITTTDPDAGDTLVITATAPLPTWLTLTDNGDRTATLSGTPNSSQVGVYNISLQVSDGTLTDDQSFDITVGNTAPQIIANGVNTVADTGDGVLNDFEVVGVAITQILVRFNQDVYAGGGPNDATNAANYMLIRDNGDGFQTTACNTGVDPQDTAITIQNPVSYSNGGGAGPFVSTLIVNGGLPLANGNYRLFVCGTTSIVDIADNNLRLAGDGTTPGTDFIRNFTVFINNNGNAGGNTGDGGDGGGRGARVNAASLAGGGVLIPVTGFAPNQTTLLPAQPLDKAYKPMNGMRIEIPTLGIDFPIVGAPLTENGWDLTWLRDGVAYLEGSAYPTWSGNTVLTAHVAGADNNLGPFSDIKGMKKGDYIYLHTGGQTFVYQAQENRKISPLNISAVFKHQDYDWVTLVTCEDYNKQNGTYKYRRMVRAVLVSVLTEK